jgi:two-component system nitrogen regulation response regulator NtrX
MGAFDFLEKPLTIEKVVVVVKNSIEQRRMAIELGRLAVPSSRYPIIGESVPMKAVRQQLALMAATNGRVLIYGESGTGKELVAHAIHALSPRAKEAFVEVNCAAIPEDLIESELFGHRRGAFAGASEDKTGKIQKADGGTLFLDEVGDMSLRTQAKLLRVLDEQRVEPVGALESVRVDCRVVAATNKQLEQEIDRGNFRSTYPPCVTGSRTSRCWPATFSTSLRAPTVARPKNSLPTPWPCSRTTRGRATSGSCET